MTIFIFFIGLLIGLLLNLAVNRISYDICKSKIYSVNLFIIFISGILFLTLFLRFGFGRLFIKGELMTAILIIVSFVDLKHEIIPDKLWILALIGGMLFVFIGDMPLIGSLLGMLTGGILLFLLALLPDALGGGDIKIMFGLGAFLGPYKTLWAIFLAFALSAVVSIFLLVLKIKGRKDHIPFGPFLALGSFISFLI
ncbi:MAG: putative type leader peptidase [Clostridia bacterium]|jgi:leader peptidase (prepilin peptidase)/N-methyltransferase|nr:putative type leader peptidase [Clostridia bacterium]